MLYNLINDLHPSADVLHNLTELNDDIEKNKEKAFSNFNTNKENTIARYKKLIPEIKKSWSGNPLNHELESQLSLLLERS